MPRKLLPERLRNAWYSSGSQGTGNPFVAIALLKVDLWFTILHSILPDRVRLPFEVCRGGTLLRSSSDWRYPACSP